MAITALSDDALLEKIKEKQIAIEDANKEFEEEVKKLQKKYAEFEDAKMAKVASIKKTGLSVMRSVCSSRSTCVLPPEPKDSAGEDEGEGLESESEGQDSEGDSEGEREHEGTEAHEEEDL